MFGFALAAVCMPAHDDWLNDLSSTPPVSSTMQALIVLPRGGCGRRARCVALPTTVPPAGAELVLPPPLLLLPHADRVSATCGHPCDDGAGTQTTHDICPFENRRHRRRRWHICDTRIGAGAACARVRGVPNRIS